METETRAERVARIWDLANVVFSGSEPRFPFRDLLPFPSNNYLSCTKARRALAMMLYYYCFVPNKAKYCFIASCQIYILSDTCIKLDSNQKKVIQNNNYIDTLVKFCYTFTFCCTCFVSDKNYYLIRVKSWIVNRKKYP